jgi:hypothetical protein
LAGISGHHTDRTVCSQIQPVIARRRQARELAIEALHDQAGAARNLDQLYIRGRQAAASGQAHTEVLVARQARVLASWTMRRRAQSLAYRTHVELMQRQPAVDLLDCHGQSRIER